MSFACDFPEDAKRMTRMIEPIFDTVRLDRAEIDALVGEHVKSGKSIYRIRSEELRKTEPDLIIQELCAHMLHPELFREELDPTFGIRVEVAAEA